MKILTKILKYILVVPIFLSAGIFVDVFKELIGDYLGLIVGVIILSPFGVGLFLSFLNHYKSRWTQFLGFGFGILLLTFGFGTLPDRLEELNMDRKDKWENVELLINESESKTDQQRRKNAFEQKRAAKLLEIKANEIRFDGEPEWFKSSVNNYIMLATGVLLLILTFLDHREIEKTLPNNTYSK